MIAQELLHKFKCTSGKKGFFAWKIDLAKAYDRLSWGFIEKVLTEVNIPEGLRNLIMHCVTSTSFQVLVNGEMSDVFHGSRGVRQGDPISPYIFVLCMEKLSHIISHAVNAGVWKPVKATRFGPHISHLFFADDLILFAEASVGQAGVLKKIMDIFCAVSGQTVSFEKSVVFCSPNVHSDLANSISFSCGSPLTSDLGKYLGMPLLHSRVNRHTYAYLIDKVHARLAGWKCKVLNMAGRLTLIHSVNSAIPIYAMQTTKLPISTCDALDKLNRNFLWGDTAEKRRVHAVNWATVCRPKRLGGLGIKRTRDMNQALLAKAGWRMVQGDKGLWCQLFHRKYLSHASLLQNYKTPASCSSTWSSLVHGAELLKQGLKWRIGDGCGVNFWCDNWSGFGKLRDFVDGRDDVNLNDQVCDFWCDKVWNRRKLSYFLPEEVIDSICVIPIARTEMRDSLIWNASPDGKFSVKSAYLLHFAEDAISPYPWFKNWSLKIPPKLKLFLWSLVAGKLLTNHQRMCRKFTNDPSCFHCSGRPETLLHLLRECPKAKMVWSAFDIPVRLSDVSGSCCQVWLEANLSLKTCVFGQIPWNVLFSFCCWHLWKWRCKCVFDSSFNLPYNAYQIIMDCVEEWLAASEVNKSGFQGCEVLLHWICPPSGIVKLNVDGARSNEGVIGAGGVLRKSDGGWCRGFMASLGVGEVLQAEAWGLFHGLQMAFMYGADKILCESDSTDLVNLILHANVEVHPLGTIIRNCREIMQQFSSCSLSHVYREVNTVADSLAKSSLRLDKGLYILEHMPAAVAGYVENDATGVTRLRRIPDMNRQDVSGLSASLSRQGCSVPVSEDGRHDGAGSATWAIMQDGHFGTGECLSMRRGKTADVWGGQAGVGQGDSLGRQCGLVQDANLSYDPGVELRPSYGQVDGLAVRCGQNAPPDVALLCKQQNSSEEKG